MKHLTVYEEDDEFATISTGGHARVWKVQQGLPVDQNLYRDDDLEPYDDQQEEFSGPLLLGRENDQ